MSHRFGPIALVSSLLVLACLPAQELQVGAAAPAFSLTQMVRGEPVKALAKEVVHVVEFWGDQPGMGFDREVDFARLKKEHGAKLQLVAVVGAGAEDEYDYERVASYYQEHGAHLPFTIGYDGDGKLQQSWLIAAAQESPVVFVVDEQGRVAWIGGLGYLDVVLSKIVAGNCDPTALAADTAAAQKQMMRVIMTASLKPAGAMAELDKLVKQWPCLEFTGVTTTWTTLLEGDEPKLAIALEKRVCDLAIAAADVAILNHVAWQIVDPEVERDSRDVATAERAAKKAVELTKEQDPSLLDTLARVYFWTKDYAQAVAWQKKAVAACPEDEEDAREGLAETLREYEQLVGGGGGGK